VCAGRARPGPPFPGASRPLAGCSPWLPPLTATTSIRTTEPYRTYCSSRASPRVVWVAGRVPAGGSPAGFKQRSRRSGASPRRRWMALCDCLLQHTAAFQTVRNILYRISCCINDKRGGRSRAFLWVPPSLEWTGSPAAAGRASSISPLAAASEIRSRHYGRASDSNHNNARRTRRPGLSLRGAAMEARASRVRHQFR
jgi:hypothetical protein